MAIDIRATVTCSLGTLISASISDDYLQGTGLVKCKGSCEISGIVTPAIGTVVTFSYTQGGVTRSVPRKLRVLSSFADPFRRTTKVELGCKLTYLQDLKEAVDWTAFDDPENAALTTADAEIITIPFHASSVMSKCLTELGITASSNPLTNKFSIASFDYGPGYVQVLSDLLVSESYCGYLDTSEVLQVFSLDQTGGTGPVLDSTQIIDLGPIGVGQLPGEAVTVSYSTLRLKSGDVNGDSTLWSSSLTVNISDGVLGYTASDGSAAAQYFTSYEANKEFTTYGEVNGKNVPLTRQQTNYKTAASVIGTIYSQYLSNGIGISTGAVLNMSSTEVFGYDSDGNEVYSILTTTADPAYGYGALGLTYAYGPSDYYVVGEGGSILWEKVIKRSSYNGDFRQTTTERYGPWFMTVGGQQAIAEAGKGLTSASDVTNFLATGVLDGSYLLDTSTVTESTATKSQQAPSKADINNQARAKGGDPNNGYRTDSKSELELALGSATAQRRIELSLPYAPDDVFVKNAGPPVSYTTIASDAPQKAKKYGVVQNRLLLGNRSGMNLQVAAPKLPSAPFAPLVVQANGLSALYRVNGSSWTMDSSGIVASTDALFWGAVGGTGSFWFPVAPGITTLPTTPAVVDGAMTVSATVPVWNETVLADARTRVGVTVQSFAYPLEVLTVVPAIGLRTGITATRIVGVSVPAANIALAAPALTVTTSLPLTAIAIAAPVPAISTGAAVTVPATDLALTAVPPVVSAGASVAVPSSDVAVQMLAPTLAVNAIALQVPVTDVLLGVWVPGVSTGVVVSVPASDFSVAALAPEFGGNLGDRFDLTALLADDLLTLNP